MRCTIYSPVVDHPSLQTVQALIPDWSLQLEGEPTRWSSARFVQGQSVLVFNSRVFTAPMDEFSKIILGTYNYFRRRPDLSEPVREDILQFTSDAQWLIGVVATSESLSEDFFWPLALAWARRLGGRVFNGTDLVVPGAHPLAPAGRG